MNSKKQVIAAFDFDGTISYFDTLIPFLWTVTGSAKTFKNLAICTPVFFKFLNNKTLRQQAKEQLLETFLKEKTFDSVSQDGRKYAEGLLNKLIKPKALKRIAWHRQQGHQTVLISANLRVYLEPWGQNNGIDHVLASELQVDANNQITGKLNGSNCWGEEKVRRLKELFGPKENYILYAYGNSRGDQELLEFADYPFYRTFE